MTPQRTDDSQRNNLWKIADTVIKVSFPFVMTACGTACGYVYSELQAHERKLAVMEVIYQTKQEANSSFESLKDLIHDIDKKLSRIVPEGK